MHLPAPYRHGRFKEEEEGGWQLPRGTEAAAATAILRLDWWPACQRVVDGQQVARSSNQRAFRSKDHMEAGTC